LGEDRLGGAKMGFLDSNILLRVVDSSGTDYKVMLSANHHALHYQDIRSTAGRDEVSALLPEQ
jgi:hypothetical protein